MKIAFKVALDFSAFGVKGSKVFVEALFDVTVLLKHKVSDRGFGFIGRHVGDEEVVIRVVPC